MECRFYSREEISKTLSIDLKDSKHFAERIKTTLEKWGYQYEYSRSGVMITEIPLLPEAQLREILIRKLNLDTQIDTYAFACFLCAFTDINHFDSMPWEERADKMLERYNVNVSDRTLRNWCRKLMDQNIIQKGGERTFWKTEIICGKKIRVHVPEGNEEMTNYFQKRSEYLQQEKQIAAAAGLRGQEATNQAWAETHKQLWREFQCCYYTCKGWTLNAIQEDFVLEIYELSQELAAEKGRNTQPDKSITSKEEFHETWFTQKLI